MVTSDQAFAARSYDYEDVVDYLVKPLSYDRFQAMQRVTGKQAAVTEAVTTVSDAFFTKDGNKNVRIKLSDVLFIKSEDNYVAFVFPESQTLSLFTLKDLEVKLPRNFKRVHRSYIVNLDRIDYLTPEEIVLGDKKVPIGEKYRGGLDSSLNAL
jgi:DNA-binding LytR/AlgR family response regulator